MTGDQPSKTQIDRLGERLRAGSRDEADIRTVDAYRNSFRPALVEVMDRLAALPYEKTGRMKTIDAIRAKLNRQPIRLTQIQDIAGFRVTCHDPPAQETLTALLSMQFKGSEVDDLRERPSHGYRAVHVLIYSDSGRCVEVQVRTVAQHRWAQLSEKLADLIDPGVKYGRGPDWAQAALAEYSETVRNCEVLERQHADLCDLAHESRLRAPDALSAAEHERLVTMANDLEASSRDQRTLDRELERIAASIERYAQKWRGLK